MSKRFIIETLPEIGMQAEITDLNEIRHITKALRLKPGDEILLSDGRGKNATARIVGIGKHSVSVSVLSVSEADRRAGAKLILWQGCLKSPRMDWLVEKTVELNIDEFRPLRCQYSVATGEKRDRWERIARAALKQSGADKLMEIHDAVSFAELPRFEQKTDFLFFLSIESPPQPGLIEMLRLKAPDAAGRIHLFVGPEGGFSPNELGQLRELGAAGCSLGFSILRGETAGILACGIARHWIDFLSG